MKSPSPALIFAACLLMPLPLGSQIIDPQVDVIEVAPGDRFLRWQAQAGYTYFIQASDPNTHLEGWIWAPCIENSSTPTEISYEIGTTAEKAFFRLHYTDQSPPSGTSLEDWDADGDGLSNQYELSIQTNPLNPDTSGDGISDGWAVAHGLNPLLDNSAGLFQSTTTTNLAAYQAGVQANSGATLDDHDADDLNNEEDVDPNDTDLNWQRAGNAAYVLVDLEVPSTAGQARDINDKGEVLFDTGIWSAGQFIPIEALPFQSIRPGPGEDNDSDYEVEANFWTSFNDTQQLTGYATLNYSNGPFTGPIGTVLQWTPGALYSRHAPSALPYYDYNDGDASPVGISDSGVVFSRFTYVTGASPTHTSIARILVTAANGTHQSLLSGQDGWHPVGSQGYSDVSGNGWLISNTASTLNGAADYRLALWDPSQTLISLPSAANGFFSPLHLADLDEDQILIAAGTQSGTNSDVFIGENGNTKHLPSLSGKKIRLFAGDGTGITSDGKLWRNGELIPMRDLCQQWADLEDDDWTLQPLKANKHGVYLIQAVDTTETSNWFLINPARLEIRHQLEAKWILPGDLRVSKWESAWSSTGTFNESFIDAGAPSDIDRIRVVVEGFLPPEKRKIFISSTESQNGEHDDDPTEMTLTEIVGEESGSHRRYESKPFILVADENDNRFNKDNQTDDQTHMVSLGSELVISADPAASEPLIRIPIKEKKIIDVTVKLLWQGEEGPRPPTMEKLTSSLKVTSEIYAQAGIRLNWNVQVSKVELFGVNLGDGLRLDHDVSQGVLDAEGLAVLNHYATPNDADVVCLFIDGQIKTGASPDDLVGGIAIEDNIESADFSELLLYWSQNVSNAFKGTFLVSAEEATVVTMGHELAHILTLRHPEEEKEPFEFDDGRNVMHSPTQHTGSYLHDTKRFREFQQTRMHNSQFVENPE
jgi:hypothetical protein